MRALALLAQLPRVLWIGTVTEILTDSALQLVRDEVLTVSLHYAVAPAACANAVLDGAVYGEPFHCIDPSARLNEFLQHRLGKSYQIFSTPYCAAYWSARQPG